MVEHFAHDVNFGRGSVIQPKCELEVRVDFSDGSTRDGQLVEVFADCQPTIAFGDTGSDRNRCSTKLRRQAELLLAWNL
jgi:hypothetical protein